MSLCTKTHLVSDAGGESPTPTHSSAASRAPHRADERALSYDANSPGHQAVVLKGSSARRCSCTPHGRSGRESGRLCAPVADGTFA